MNLLDELTEEKGLNYISSLNLKKRIEERQKANQIAEKAHCKKFYKQSAYDYIEKTIKEGNGKWCIVEKDKLSSYVQYLPKPTFAFSYNHIMLETCLSELYKNGVLKDTNENGENHTFIVKEM